MEQLYRLKGAFWVMLSKVTAIGSYEDGNIVGVRNIGPHTKVICDGVHFAIPFDTFEQVELYTDMLAIEVAKAKQEATSQSIKPVVHNEFANDPLASSYALNTSDGEPTVYQFVMYILQFPLNYTVGPYEGEGGNWLVVHKP